MSSGGSAPIRLLDPRRAQEPCNCVASHPRSDVSEPEDKEKPMTVHKQAHEQDAALADELRAHHAVMIEELDRLSSALSAAAASGDASSGAKLELERWISEVLVPHAEEEEKTTYRAASGLLAGELLIKSMLAEHDLIRLTARNIKAAADPVASAAIARALFDTFDSHQRKENDIVLPLLVETDAVSLTAIMADAHGHSHDDGDRHRSDQGHSDDHSGHAH